MSREILFRAKRIDNGEWVEGLLTIMWMQYHIINPSDENTAYPIDTETICQYTGLTDKNGRRFFEGDILSAHLDDQYPEDITYVQITWNGFSWCTRESTEDDVMTEHDCNIFEVCGNIFDNPKLMGD